MQPLSQNDIPVFKKGSMAPRSESYKPGIYYNGGIKSFLDDTESEVACRQLQEQRRAANALAQMLKAYGGISSLSCLSPKDRQEIAAKVDAIQQQVLQTSPCLISSKTNKFAKITTGVPTNINNKTKSYQSRANIIYKQDINENINNIEINKSNNKNINYLLNKSGNKINEKELKKSCNNSEKCNIIINILPSIESQNEIENKVIKNNINIENDTKLNESNLKINNNNQKINLIPSSQQIKIPTISSSNIKLESQTTSSSFLQLEEKPSILSSNIQLETPLISFSKIQLESPTISSSNIQLDTKTTSSSLLEIEDREASLKQDILNVYRKAQTRRRISAINKNSVESRVWKSRRIWKNEIFNSTEINKEKEEEEEEEEEDNNKLNDDNYINKISKYPIWCGSQFWKLPENKDIKISPVKLLVPIAAWWDEIFKDETDNALTASDAVNAEALVSNNQKDDDIKEKNYLDNNNSVSYVTIIEDGTYTGSPIEACYYRTSDKLTSQLYPPSVKHTISNKEPIYNLPKTKEFEYDYCHETYTKDRFLQEVLRGKFNLASDLERPIPKCILESLIEKNNNNWTLGHSDESNNNEIINTSWQLNNKDIEDDIAKPIVTNHRSRREGLRSRSSYRTYPVDISSSYYSTNTKNKFENNDYTALDNIPNNKNISNTRNSAYSDKLTTKTFTTPKGNTTPTQLESDFDVIKKASGWHPYVWYLMCRRPELYGIGIRARVVARVAGWEWDDIQKSSDLLHSFLERIYNFVTKNPVPRLADKKELKEYKHFAANSVRTPWYQMETAAVRRALRDLENGCNSVIPVLRGANDSDSGPSDGSEQMTSFGREGRLSPLTTQSTPVPSEYSDILKTPQHDIPTIDIVTEDNVSISSGHKENNNITSENTNNIFVINQDIQQDREISEKYCKESTSSYISQSIPEFSDSSEDLENF